MMRIATIITDQRAIQTERTALGMIKLIPPASVRRMISQMKKGRRKKEK